MKKTALLLLACCLWAVPAAEAENDEFTVVTVRVVKVRRSER